MRLLALCAVLVGAACVEDPLALTAEEQADWNGGPEDPEGETIVIEGSIDACWDAGLCWPGVEPEDPTDPGDTGDGYGGGGVGPGPNDNWEKIPKGEGCRKDTEYYEECTACCDRNYWRVWLPHCDKQRNKAEACRRHVQTYTYPGCIAGCWPKKLKDPGILTGGGNP